MGHSGLVPGYIPGKEILPGPSELCVGSPTWPPEVSRHSLQPSYLPPRSILVLHLFQPLHPPVGSGTLRCVPRTKLESASVCKLDLLETFLSPGACCPGLRHLHFLASGVGKSSYFPIWVFLTPDKYLSSPPTPNNLSLTWSGGAETPTPHTSCPDFSLF